MSRWPAALLGLCVLAAACGDGPASRLFVLGIDGMDPTILRRLMSAGRMPNFEALAQRGGMASLATTMPPQSPVAWSSFITGLAPTGHGIFDFVHRDAEGQYPSIPAARMCSPAAVSLSTSSGRSHFTPDSR